MDSRQRGANPPRSPTSFPRGVFGSVSMVSVPSVVKILILSVITAYVALLELSGKTFQLLRVSNADSEQPASDEGRAMTAWRSWRLGARHNPLVSDDLRCSPPEIVARRILTSGNANGTKGAGGRPEATPVAGP